MAEKTQMHTENIKLANDILTGGKLSAIASVSQKAESELRAFKSGLEQKLAKLIEERKARE